MSALLVGYARCSTDQQDLTAQRDALLGLGVAADRIASTTVSPPPTANSPACGKRWRPVGPETRWW
jgi:hypothetical protein